MMMQNDAASRTEFLGSSCGLCNQASEFEYGENGLDGSDGGAEGGTDSAVDGGTDWGRGHAAPTTANAEPPRTSRRAACR
jgi:hypothetical protein